MLTFSLASSSSLLKLTRITLLLQLLGARGGGGGGGGSYSLKWPIRGGSFRKKHLFELEVHRLRNCYLAI